MLPSLGIAQAYLSALESIESTRVRDHRGPRLARVRHLIARRLS
jgi:hypothetical protein